MRDPDLLVAINRNGSAVTWREPLAKVFTLPGASTDWGWNFDRLERAGQFVGSPGWPPVRRTPGSMVFDLSQTMTAGFRIRDGAAVWRDRGSNYACTLLPCPGQTESGYATLDERQNPPSLGLRLRALGSLSAGSNLSSLVVHASPTARVTIEGFKAATGRTVWSFDAGHATGLITHGLSGEPLPPRVAENTIVLPGKHGQNTALNLVNGAHPSIQPTAAAWCRDFVLYKAPGPFSDELTEHVGQLALFPCTASGHRTATLKTIPAFVAGVGAKAGGLIAWSDTTGIHAAPTAP
jgi:hypothetical protein